METKNNFNEKKHLALSGVGIGLILGGMMSAFLDKDLNSKSATMIITGAVVGLLGVPISKIYN